MSTKRSALVFLFACLPIGLAQGEPGSIVDPYPFRLSETPGYFLPRYGVDIAADGDGNLTVVWENGFEDTGWAIRYMGIWARRVAASGVPLGPPFRVAPQGYRMPAIVMQPSGRFVVAGQQNSSRTTPDRLLFQRYNAAGAPLGAAVFVDIAGAKLNPTWGPKLAMDAGGNFLVLWVGGGIHAQLFNANGTARSTPFLIKRATAPTAVGQPAVAMSAGGEFVVVWERTVDLGSAAVLGQRFDADGMQVGPEFTVAPQNSQTTRLMDVSVAMDGDGNFVVGYERRIPDPSGSVSLGIFARRFDAAANALGAQFRVSKQGINLGSSSLALDMNAAGDIAFAWASHHTNAPWRHTRLFASNGSAVPERSLAGYVRGMALAMNADGSYIFAWGDYAVYAQRVAGPQDAQPACSIYVATDVGTSSADVITGTPGDDVIQALGGSDWVDGAGGDDLICGGGGSDQLYGLGGRDQLFGDKGDDVLDGGVERDTCDGGEHDNADTALNCETVINIP